MKEELTMESKEYIYILLRMKILIMLEELYRFFR